MKLSKRESIFIAVVGIILMAVLYTKLILLPENSKIAILKAMREQKLIQLSQLKDKDKKIEDINSEIKKKEEKIESKKEPIASPIRVPEVLDEINRIAFEKKVMVDRIRFSGDASSVKGELSQQLAVAALPGQNNAPQSTAANSNASGGQVQGNVAEAPKAAGKDSDMKLKTLMIDFSVYGNYNDIMEFMNYYEKNARLFVIDSFKVTFVSGMCICDVTLKTVSISMDKPDFMYQK